MTFISFCAKLMTAIELFPKGATVWHGPVITTSSVKIPRLYLFVKLSVLAAKLMTKIYAISSIATIYCRLSSLCSTLRIILLRSFLCRRAGLTFYSFRTLDSQISQRFHSGLPRCVEPFSTFRDFRAVYLRRSSIKFRINF